MVKVYNATLEVTTVKFNTLIKILFEYVTTFMTAMNFKECQQTQSLKLSFSF